jgi:hypothetical protein
MGTGVWQKFLGKGVNVPGTGEVEFEGFEDFGVDLLACNLGIIADFGALLADLVKDG